jgi:hypothetical protein
LSSAAPAVNKKSKSRFVDRLKWPENGGRNWKTVPTLLRLDPKAFPGLIAIGCLISAITIAILDLALVHEMSGILSIRPLDVYIFIVGLSFLVIGAVLFYPLILLNHKMQVYVDEESERINAKYRLGLSRFNIERGKIENKSLNDYDLAKKMSQDNPDYHDFEYLHSTAVDIEAQRYGDIKSAIDLGKQTYDQIKKDILRELIYATAWENLEDSGYSLGSYIMPVTYCMSSIALGFIAFSLIPLLGTSTIMLGGTSINLIWAVGGFLGAYLYSFLPFFQRCTRRDLPPRAFLHYGLNIFIGTLGMALFGNLFLGSVSGSATQLALAAVLGSVPFYLLAEARKQGFQILESLGSFKLPGSKPKADAKAEQVGRKDLCEIPGIDVEFSDRLREESIMNIQNLAFANTEDLSKRTRLNRKMLFDWKDQAILLLLTGNIKTDNIRKSNIVKSNGANVND